MPRLTEQEQQEIIRFIEAGKPLPEQYRSVLFNEKPEAEERFRLITENIYDCVSLVDTSGVYQYVSPSYRKTLGYAPEELIGRNGFSITHPDDLERVFKLYVESMEKGYNELKYEARLIHRDGHYIPLETTALAIKDPHGNLTGGVLVSRDITERKQAEESLRLFKESVENSSDAVGMSTPEGKHYYQNKAFDELFGAVGENPPETLFVDPAVGHEVFRTIMAGGVWTGEVKMYARDRRVLTILLRAYASKDKAGRIKVLVGVHTDITERKKAEEALREALIKWQTTFNALESAIWLLDKDMRIVVANDATQKVFRKNPQEVVGRHCWEIVYGSQEPIAECPVMRSRKTLRRESMELQVGSQWYEVTADPVIGDAGALLGFVHVVNNITERKQAEESLQRQLRYEQAIALASTCLLNHEEAPHKTVYDAIACLREATDTSRVYIFENSDDPAAGLCASLTHEACAPGVPPEIDNPLLQQMPYSSGMERWREMLSNGIPVWGCVCDFPESERANLELQGIISIMVLPLFSGGRWHGFVGFDETLTPRKWQAADVALLKTAADMIGIFMAHMRTREALRESRERYYGVYETAPIAFVLWDRACHITDWNRHAEKTFGWSREEALGRNFLDLMLPESARASVEDVVTRLLEGLLPSRSINENITKDGSIILCEWNNTIQYDSQGEVVGVLSLALDITERRRAEEERQQFTAALEARVQDYTRELKTANASLQKTTIQLRDLAKEMIQVEEREQKRLATVLHDDLQQLLVASKMKMHRLVADADPPQSKVEILALIDKSIAVSRSLVMDLSPPVLWERDLMMSLQWLARWMLEHHGLTVEISGPEEYEVSESLNILIFQAVRELLFNIVKHAGVDRAFVKVDHFAADLLRIIVNDQGRGFPPDASENFGLFRVRERLGYIGGAMQVASGHGTQVIFTVPLKPSIVTGAVSDVSNNAIVPSTAKDIRQVTYQLLVVDDHAVLRQGLVELLDKEDDIIVVGVAADGHQAVEKTRLLHPDIVLMDISMPGMSGMEATRIIMEEMPQTCIVGLSMHDQAEMKHAMHEAGAKAYVCKGEPIEDLMATIRSISISLRSDVSSLNGGINSLK